VCASTVEHRGKYPVPVSISFDTLKCDPEAALKVLVQMEPDEVLGLDLLSGAGEFDLVLAWDEDFLKLPNAELFPFGNCWIDWESLGCGALKWDVVSFITSDKGLTEGHELRLGVWNKLHGHKKIGGFELIKHQSPPWVPSKNPFYETAKFSIAIENVKQNNWFTEKLIDCFATNTVPIYWGAPNIGDFFNTRGIITFDTVDELMDILSSLHSEQYGNRLDVMRDNFERSKQYWGFHERIRDRILERIGPNTLAA